MICKDKKKECMAFLSFEYICRTPPVCSFGKIIKYDEEKKIWYSEECKRFYSSIDAMIEEKKRK